MASSSSSSSIKINTKKSYVLKERSVTVPLDRLDVQVEAPVDFESLERNGVDVRGHIGAQQMDGYFQMLFGTTYMNLVKDFWVRAKVFDRKASEEEEAEIISKNPSMKRKSREEMGLRKYTGVEIRSAVMGMEVTINEEIIARACRCSEGGQFQWDAPKAIWEGTVNATLFHGRSKGRVSEMATTHRVLLKIMNECMLQRGGGSDQPSLDHKVVLYFLTSCQRINLPKYIMHHMCWAIRESQKKDRRQIPYGRLLSEIFSQGRLLQHLKNAEVVSDEELGSVTGKIFNGRTLRSMKIIEKVTTHKDDLREDYVKSKLMQDFPSVCKKDNPTVIIEFIKAHRKETGEYINIASIPDNIGGAPLKIKGKRSKLTTSEDVSAPEPKRPKLSSSTASGAESGSVPGKIKKRLYKGQRNLKEDIVEEWNSEEKGESASKKVKKPLSMECPMFEMTPELKRMANDYAANRIAERKEMKMIYEIQRDEQLRAAGLLEPEPLNAEQVAERAAEGVALSSECEQETVKEATTLLKQALKGKGTSGATPSEPESEAIRTE
ncbi:hypothetical protein MTR_6g039060 [Medicago truncatula]|uniref:Uncharacterized protein n=1 Tax=Medicago truncatula TaxID=3880 RepID=A0A072UJI6_MEDTR|nr:hypothetical protein MTR_6g039060 [Medicago truncatula]